MILKTDRRGMRVQRLDSLLLGVAFQRVEARNSTAEPEPVHVSYANVKFHGETCAE